MVDAALLAMPDEMGGVLWHPARLDDIYDLPAKTLRYYLAYRSGRAWKSSRAHGGGKQGTIGGKKVS